MDRFQIWAVKQTKKVKMKKVSHVIGMIAALIISLLSNPLYACPILVGTDNQGPPPVVAIPDPPGSGYVPPGYITDITVNGTKDFNITYTRTSDNVKKVTPVTTGETNVKFSGIADDGWHGTKITSWGMSGNFIQINGVNEISVSGDVPQGATQNWQGANGGVQEIIFGGSGGITLRGYSVVGGQFVIGKAGLDLQGGCRVNPAGTLNGYILSLSATPTATATSVQFYIDNVAAGALDSSSPFAYTSGALTVGNHSYYALATWPNGTVKSSTTSVSVNNPTSVSAGKTNACVVILGSAKCWGVGQFGVLGNGSTTDASSPVQVTGITSGATAISVGWNHVCAVVNGGVKCWGKNAQGVLGTNPATLASSSTPLDVIAANSNVIDVSSGADTSCALFYNGKVKCWGNGAYGQIGNGTKTVINTSPIEAVASGATKVSIGTASVCAVINGGIKCWGENIAGQLGNGTVISSTTPTQVTGITSGATDVSEGYRLTCAVVSGAVKCWGDNSMGGVGNGSAGPGGPGRHPLLKVTTPSTVAGVTGVVSVSAGDQTSCAVLSTGVLKCWGMNTFGQMGQNNTSDYSLTPVIPTNTASTLRVSSGYNFLCSVTNNHIKCWGDNTYYQIGDPAASNPTLVPYQVPGL